MSDPTANELPAGYATRAPTTEDFRAVAALILASDLADFGEPDYPEEELLADWKGLDLATDARVVVAPGGEFAGYGFVERHGPGRLYAEGFLHPEHRGRGVGSHLIRLTEARARELAALAPPGSRVVLDNAINGQNAAARRLLENHGYEPVRHFRRMTIEFAGAPPEPEWPPGVSVRPCSSVQDERAAFETLDEAFRDHWEHHPKTFEEWEKRKKRAGHEPGLWFLATAGGAVAGAAVCQNRSEAGWVDELGVRHPWRRRGLALALLRHSFGEFYRRGRRRVSLGVDSQSLTGATRLYERAGMRTDRLYSAYRKELRPGERAGER